MSHPLDRLRPGLRPAWVEPDPIPATAPLADLHPHPVVAQILWRRGLTDAASALAFTDPAHAPAPDPDRLPNMDRAVARVREAVNGGQRVAIFGDYDADGVTSAAILTHLFRRLVGKDNVLTMLPERSEGYGLNLHGVQRAASFGAALLVTVDCGSSDHAAVAAARAAGLDVLVLDHHRIDGDPPVGAIVVSPQLGDDAEMRHLTGAGVAWMLACALAREGMDASEGNGHTERHWLDLVAIGTVADVSSLLGVNRGIVRDGVTQLRATHRPGLQALAYVAEQDLRALTAADISFTIAPRLNAAGRIDTPRLAFDLLMSSDPEQARHLALELERVNRQRKEIAESITADAAARILAQPGWEQRPLLIAASPDWPAGMVGAVAARLVEASGRPTILLHAGDDGVLAGSARAVDGMDIGSMIASLGHLLERHGGHSGAAGLSLRADRLEPFTAGLAAAITASGMALPATATLRIDADLPPEAIGLDTVHALASLEPMGRDNAIPLFRIRGAALDRYSVMGAARNHLRIALKVGNRRLEGVYWNAAERSRELVGRRIVDVVGTLGINTFRGERRLQMDLKDFRAD